MLFSPTFWLVSTAIILVAGVCVRRQHLSKIPGPLLASLTDLWRFTLTQTGKYQSVHRRLHQKYGPLVRIGPNNVSISDPAAVPIVHGMHGEFRKADSYSTLRVLYNGKRMGTVVDIQDEAEVTSLKRAVGSAFATKNLLDYEPDVDYTLEILVQEMRQRRVVSLLDVVQQFQVDFLMKAAFSKDTNYLQANQSTAPVSGEKRLQHWCAWQSIPVLETLLYQSPLCRAWYMKTGNLPVWTTMAVDEYTKRQSEKAQGLLGGKADLLTKYLAGAEQHKDRVPETTMVKIVSSTMAAGFDTSAYTITMMLYFLLKNPHVLKKLQDEIQQALDTGRLSNPPRYVETDKFEYLGAVFSETVRLAPVLKTPLERVVPVGGADIAGQYIPEGTTVGMSTWHVHHNKAVFGEDADEFRPERWLEANEHHKHMMAQSILAFGSGKRICLGRHIAELEIRKVVPRLFMEFNLSFKDPNCVYEPKNIMSNFPKPIYIVCDDKV